MSLVKKKKKNHWSNPSFQQFHKYQLRTADNRAVAGCCPHRVLDRGFVLSSSPGVCSLILHPHMPSGAQQGLVLLWFTHTHQDRAQAEQGPHAVMAAAACGEHEVHTHLRARMFTLRHSAPDYRHSPAVCVGFVFRLLLHWIWECSRNKNQVRPGCHA